MFDNDETLYEAVARELENNIIKKGLWTKALSLSHFDEKNAKAIYIKLRVKAIKRELHERRRIERQVIVYEKEKKQQIEEAYRAEELERHNEKITQLNAEEEEANQIIEKSENRTTRYVLAGAVLGFFLSAYPAIRDYPYFLPWLLLFLAFPFIGYFIAQYLVSVDPERAQAKQVVEEIRNRKEELGVDLNPISWGQIILVFLLVAYFIYLIFSGGELPHF